MRKLWYISIKKNRLLRRIDWLDISSHDRHKNRQDFATTKLFKLLPAYKSLYKNQIYEKGIHTRDKGVLSHLAAGDLPPSMDVKDWFVKKKTVITWYLPLPDGRQL